MIRTCSALLLLAVFSPLGAAQSVDLEIAKAKAKAKASLSLAAAARAREAKQHVSHDYTSCLAKSTINNTPMVVLIGVDRPDLVDALDCCVLRHDTFPVKGPAIVVSRGGAWLKTLPADTPLDAIQGVLSPPPAKLQSYSPVFRSALFATAGC